MSNQEQARESAHQVTRVEVTTQNRRSYENYLRDVVFTERREVIADTGMEQVTVKIVGYRHAGDKSPKVL